MRKIMIFAVMALVLFSFMPSPAHAQEEICAYYFWGQGCPHCANVDPVLEELAEKYPQFDVQSFEIYVNRENVPVLQEMFEKYDVPVESQGIPVLFIGDKHFIGDVPIISGLEAEIEEHLSTGLECPGSGGSDGDGISHLSWGVILGAAVVDSINPCALAVLLILLGTLLAAGERKRAFYSGLAFTISIYIVYFLFGLGLFSAIQISGLSYYFYKFIGLLAVIIGLLNIKDFFWYRGGGFAMEIPMRWRPRMKSLLRSVTSPMGAFFMGFLVSLFELPCTGGPYIFILGLLAEKATQAAAIPVLLIYNLIFILPLVILSFAMFYGYTSVEKAGEWKDRNIRQLHLVAGLIMLAIGAVVLFGLV